MDNIINQPSLSKREEEKAYEIKKIKYTISELRKLKEDKCIEINILQQSKYKLTNDDFQYPIEYFKIQLKIVAIVAVINEIDNMVKSQQQLLMKEYEYLHNILQEKEMKGFQDDFVPALGADSVINE